MPYKGAFRDWSNRYHFNGGTPADLTHWTTLANAIIAQEKLIFDANVSITEWTGYAAGSDVPVASALVSVAGTGSGFGGSTVSGAVAALVRYNTAARTSKNHPIYLFNYYHWTHIDNSVDQDKLASGYVTALNTYGTDWLTGFSDGTNTYTRAGPNGASALTRTTLPYATHRDFPS